MYSIYFSEERRRSGQNGTRPSGLLSQMAPYCVARHSFEPAKPHSSRLAWNHLGLQRNDLASVKRPQCSFNVITTGSASWEAVDRKARLAGNGLVLGQRCNATDDRFPARPKGGPQMSQYRVAALEKDMPFSAVCALSWNIWEPLNS